MKLLFCPNCKDIIRLVEGEERFCTCKKVSGAYIDDKLAWYRGEDAVPLGIDNHSLIKTLYEWYDQECICEPGIKFEAFIISSLCETFIRRNT